MAVSPPQEAKAFEFMKRVVCGTNEDNGVVIVRLYGWVRKLSYSFKVKVINSLMEYKLFESRFLKVHIKSAISVHSLYAQ